jgi:hypothetical protein
MVYYHIETHKSNIREEKGFERKSREGEEKERQEQEAKVGLFACGKEKKRRDPDGHCAFRPGP